MTNDGVLAGVVEAFQRADVTTAASLMSPEVVWHSPGRRQPAAGTHRGLKHVLGAFGTIATAPGTLTLEITAALTGTDGYETVVYRHRRAGDGRTLDANIALVARVHDGHLVEVWEHIYDLFTFDEFYAATPMTTSSTQSLRHEEQP